MKEHIRKFKRNCHDNKFLQQIYNIYGEDKLEYVVIEAHEQITNEALNAREVYYIEYYNTYISGANRTIGGDTVTGMTHTEEMKKKMSVKFSGEKNPFYGKTHTKKSIELMSEFQKGKTINENQRNGLATQWQKGVPKSELHRKRISDSLQGRTFSQETIKKMSESSKGRKWTEESKLKRRNTMRKLSDKEISEIYIKSQNEAVTNKSLAIEYGIGSTMVSNIKNLKIDYIKEIITKMSLHNIKEIN